MKKKRVFSWGTIVIMFFLFFPVSIYMLVNNMTGDNFSYTNNGKYLKVIGCVLLILGCMWFVLIITGEFDTKANSVAIYYLISVLSIFGGILCLYKGFSYTKRGIKYDRYLAIVKSTEDLSIDTISELCLTTFDTAVEDLQAMIDEGYIKVAYIDRKQRKLVMQRRTTNSNVNE